VVVQAKAKTMTGFGNEIDSFLLSVFEKIILFLLSRFLLLLPERLLLSILRRTTSTCLQTKAVRFGGRKGAETRAILRQGEKTGCRPRAAGQHVPVCTEKFYHKVSCARVWLTVSTSRPCWREAGNGNIL